MPNKFSPNELKIEEWIKRATDDELSSKALLEDKDGAPNTVCFLSQQMTEKYLKAFLVYKKNWFPRIHPVDKLWELCQEIDQDFNEIKMEALFLTGFYAPARYPGDYPEFSWEDAEEAFEAATRIKEFILEKIRNE